MSTTTTELLSVEQVAQRLQVSERRVRSLCVDGRFAGAQKVGSTWVVPAAALDSYAPLARGNPNWRKQAP